MLKFRILFLAAALFTLPMVAPVKNGESVGKVQIINRKLHVTNKELYPYVVHVKISYFINGEQEGGSCGGVIVGKRTIITAAHCLQRGVQPVVIVHAGVLDVDHEELRGQKIKMKEHRVHPEYKAVCKLDGIRCCYENNDIAIVWLEEEFQFGPYVQQATRNRNFQKPIGTKGWILGWGYTNKNKKATMLQRGEIQVISQEECNRYNPRVHITEKVLCLKPGSKGAKAAEGDSGGPFEIDGVVYGISSQSISKPLTCFKEEINVYTDVAHYNNWLDENLRAGPPSERPSSTSPHAHRKGPKERPYSPQRQQYGRL